MTDRRRAMAAPFYAAPRRTSAEIISEARAAIRGGKPSPYGMESKGGSAIIDEESQHLIRFFIRK